jgi:hypothetical protein
MNQMSLEKMSPPDPEWDQKNWVYTAAMCSSYPDLFGELDGNHEVERVLRKAGVLRHNNKTDSEDFQVWFYFSSRKAAQAFVDRFNKFAALVRERKSKPSNLYEGIKV